MNCPTSGKPDYSSLLARGAPQQVWAIVLLTAMSLSPSQAAPGQQPEAAMPDTETSAEGIGLQTASVFASLLYLPFKGVMALAGGLAGGIAYAFSMGDLEVAEAVWGPSVYGTYLITPEHLTGQKPVAFLGAVPDSRQ